MNEITFGQEYMPLFQNLADLEKSAKAIEKQRKELKAEICKAMEENNVKAVENDIVKITYVPETVTIGIDWKSLEWEEPELFEEIAKKFNKETHRKAYVKVTPR